MVEELKQFKNEVIEHFDKRTTEIEKRFDEKTTEMQKYMDEKTEETKRHFDVVSEGVKHEIRLVTEGVTMANQRIDNVQKDVNKLNGRMEIMEVKMVSVEGKVDKLGKDVGIIKTDVAFIKNELTQKVSRQESVLLEKRVALLENRSG